MAIATARATATLRLMRAAQVNLLVGTDTPSNEGIGNPPGLNGRFELGRWADAGVPAPEILRAATLANVRAFGFSDRGTIEAGKRADLLPLRKNPTPNGRSLRRNQTVILDGKPFPRTDLLTAK